MYNVSFVNLVMFNKHLYKSSCGPFKTDKLNADIANYFHDWVSTKFSFNSDFDVRLEVMDNNDTTHVATITFTDYKDLSFSYWTYNQEKRELVKHTERNNTQLMKDAAIDRWLQRVVNKNGLTEIVFVGGNDFCDSFVVIFTLKHSDFGIKVNDHNLKDAESLARYVNELKIFE